MDFILKTIQNCGELTYEQCIHLYKNTDLNKLMDLANEVRNKFNNNTIELCSIMNAKCGRCSEDCKYCAQSIYYSTNIKEYPMINSESAIKLAQNNKLKGVNRFSLVTSGKGLNGQEFCKILDLYKSIKNNVDIRLCASLGIITQDQLVKLKQVGVDRYHHNLETSRSFYGQICSTHDYEERIQTIKNAQRAGLTVCSGGIIGMGETLNQRIEMAFELKKLNIKSIPINILTPIKGTPFENLMKLSEEDILKTICIFRLINKDAYIRLAGGRNLLHKHGKKAFNAGANATITGDYLTTSGNSIKSDIEMLKSMGYEVI